MELGEEDLAMNLDMRITVNNNGSYHIELFITTIDGLQPIIAYDVSCINVVRMNLHEGLN
jgi:hypothetical protein